MNCQYCHTSHRKFYCTSCITEKLQKHSEEIGSVIIEKDAAVSEASQFLKKATFFQNLLAEKNKRLRKIEAIQEQQKTISIECVTKSKRIKELEQQIKEKKRLLQESYKRKSQIRSSDYSSTMKAWQRTHKMTVGTRRILVKEVASLFELKPGVVEESISEPASQQPQQQQVVDLPPFSSKAAVQQIEGKEDLYICGVTLPTRLIDVSKYPKEELNAPIGLVIHMLGLVVRYLGIKLPFLIYQKGIKPYIRMIQPNQQDWYNTRKLPLFLEDDDKNFKRFIIGMAMLNYNIAYLCHTQGVKIPVSQVANTLQSLMACCRAPGLGIQSHALYYQGIRGLDFLIDFQQVLRITTLRYSCSSHLEQSQGTLQPSSVNIHNMSNNNGLYDDYFKIRSEKNPHGNESEGEEDGIYYVDSDEEEEEGDEANFISDSKKQIEGSMNLQQQQFDSETIGDNGNDQTPGEQNETWSLVEVAPFFGGRAAHNGHESESIFQIGAASIMPGVMNMMGNGNSGGGGSSNGGANSNSGNHTTSNSTAHYNAYQKPASDRYWFPRKKNY